MRHTVPPSLNTLSFINALPHGMALLDSDGSVIVLNSVLEAITGRRSEAVAGLPLNLVLRTSLPPNDDVLKAKDNNTPVSLETDVITADRKKVPVRLTFSAISGGAQEKCTLCCLEDISAIRKFDKVRGNPIIPTGLIGHSPPMQELLEFLPTLPAPIVERRQAREAATAVVEHVDQRLAEVGRDLCGRAGRVLLEPELVHRRSLRAGAQVSAILCTGRTRCNCCDARRLDQPQAGEGRSGKSPVQSFLRQTLASGTVRFHVNA